MWDKAGHGDRHDSHLRHHRLTHEMKVACLSLLFIPLRLPVIDSSIGKNKKTIVLWCTGEFCVLERKQTQDICGDLKELLCVLYKVCVLKVRKPGSGLLDRQGSLSWVLCAWIKCKLHKDFFKIQDRQYNLQITCHLSSHVLRPEAFWSHDQVQI